MRIIKATIKPYSELLVRKHSPTGMSYSDYKNCLRWDFGFICPYCLRHESDLAEFGAGKANAIWLEHHQRQQERPDLINDYDNLLFCCRECNQNRARAPQEKDGAVLLRPDRTKWSTVFTISGTTIVPVDGSESSQYTHSTYKPNRPVKQRSRELRRGVVEKGLEILKNGPELLRLLRSAARKNPEKRREFMFQVNFHRQHLVDQWDNLKRYKAVPIDAPSTCHCAAQAEVIPELTENSTDISSHKPQGAA